MNLLTLENEANEAHGIFAHINELIGHIMWPLVVLLILYFFRNPLKEVFKRLGSIEASATGVSFSFDNQIEQAEQLDPHEDGITAKSAVQPKNDREASLDLSRSPYLQLLQIRELLHGKIANKALGEGFSTEDRSSLEIRDELRSKGLISQQQAQYFTVVYNLTGSAGKEVNQLQVNKVFQLYQRLQL